MPTLLTDIPYEQAHIIEGSGVLLIAVLIFLVGAGFGWCLAKDGPARYPDR